jgi:uncharacterized protein (TIGR04255 family)
LEHLATADYLNPPLVEVALSVDFQPIDSFGAIVMSRLAQRWAERYPEVQELPPLPVSPPVGLMPADFGRMVINVGAPQLRLWLLSPSQESLVQIQRDRLVLNWRADKGHDPYPRYEAMLRPEFERLYSDFVEFVQGEDLTPVRPFAIEAAYVNRIPQLSGVVVDLADTLRSQVHVDLTVGSPSVTRLNQIWERTHADGQRSTVSLNVDSAGMGDEAMLMTLSSRASAPSQVTVAAVMDLLDLCHHEVVVSFDELITDNRRAEWGKLS